MNDSFIIFVGVMNLLKAYRLKALRNRSAEIKRTVRMCSLNNIQKVGILWMEDDSKAFNFLYEQFKMQKVIVRNLCFTHHKAQTESTMFSRANLNWLGFPKGGNIDTFIQADFDLLLNIAVVPNFALDAVTALSVASLKIGWDQQRLGFVDISIDVSGNPDSLYLAEQQLFYLKQLNKNIDL